MDRLPDDIYTEIIKYIGLFDQNRLRLTSKKNIDKLNPPSIKEYYAYMKVNPFGKRIVFINVCARGYTELAKSLCKSIDIFQYSDYRDEDDGIRIIDYAFYASCINGEIDIAKWLHKLGANISIKENRPFEDACSRGYLDIAMWLYSLGVDIHTHRDYAIRYSYRNKHTHVVDWLCSIGVDIAVIDS